MDDSILFRGKDSRDLVHTRPTTTTTAMMRRRSWSNDSADWPYKRQFVGGDLEDYSSDDDDNCVVVNIKDEAAAAEEARLEEMLSRGAQTGNVAMCREALERANDGLLARFRSFRCIQNIQRNMNMDIEEDDDDEEEEEDWHPPLHHAALGGHIDVVKCLVQDWHFPVDQMGEYSQETALSIACRRDDVELCRLLLTELEADPHYGSSPSQYPMNLPIYVAMSRNNTEIVSLLIDHGASMFCDSKWSKKRAINAVDFAYPTEFAMRHGNVEILQQLLSIGHYIPHFVVSDDDDYGAVERMVQLGPFSTEMTTFLLSVLRDAPREYPSLADYVTLLLQFYWKQFQTMVHPDSCHHIMAFLRVGMRYDELSAILSQPPKKYVFNEDDDDDEPPSDGDNDDEDQARSTRIYRSPLVEVARSGHIGFLQALLDAGADTNEADSLGSTALHAASIAKHLKVCQILLENGAIVDYVDNSGLTPFQNLLRCGDAISGHNEVDVLLQICDALLAAGADFWKSFEDDDDKAMARAACDNDGIKCRVMERFLAAWDQRYPTGQDRAGRFPLHVAIVAKVHEKHVNLDIVRLLLRHSPRALVLPVTVANGGPWLALHWACMNDKPLDVVYTLLREYPGAVNTRTTAK